MKCFSIDLDGTLLNSKQEISVKNLQTLHDLKERGHYPILNTGRSYEDVIKFEPLKKLQLPIFCVNGSVLYTEKGELLYEATIPTSIYEEVFQLIRKVDKEIGILVYTDHGGLPSTLPPLHNKTKAEILSLFRTFNYDAILDNDHLKIYKLIAIVDYDDTEKIEKVKKNLLGKFNLSIASSFPNNAEITSGEAHKGKAILRYQKMMKLNFEEIIAFGDGGNDLAQFEIADISVAMKNAPQHVQLKADLVTKTNDEDGFAFAVEHLLNN